MEGSRISLGYGENDASNTGGEDGGEVVDSGPNPHAHVNTVPVSGSKWGKESWDRSVEKAKEGAARQNPMRRKANRLAYYCMFILLAAIGISAMGGFIISAFLGLIGYIGLVTVGIMYLISPAYNNKG